MLLKTFDKAGLLSEFKERLRNNDQEANVAFKKLLIDIAYKCKNNHAQDKVRAVSGYFTSIQNRH